MGLEGVEGIAIDNLPEQCLVFVGTRRSAEAQAKKLSRMIGGKLNAEQRKELEVFADKIQKNVRDKFSEKIMTQRQGAATDTLDDIPPKLLFDGLTKTILILALKFLQNLEMKEVHRHQSR